MIGRFNGFNQQRLYDTMQAIEAATRTTHAKGEISVTNNTIDRSSNNQSVIVFRHNACARQQ